MARRRTTGDMCALGIMDSTGATASYGGTLITLSDKTSWKTEDVVVCGSRSMERITTGISTGFSASMKVRGTDGTLIKSWIQKAIGTESDVPSFVAVAKVGPDQYHAWLNSYVDSLTVSQASAGASIQVQVDAVSVWHTFKSLDHPFTDPNGGTMDIKTAVTTPGAPPVHRTPSITIISSRGDIKTIRPKAWSLSISNALESHPSGSSALCLEAGGGVTPTTCEIILEVTEGSTLDSINDNLRSIVHNGAEGYTLDVDIQGLIPSTITLEGCVLEAGGPDRTSEGPYDETLRIKATSMEW